MSAVRPLQFVDPRYAVAFGDCPKHPDRRFRKAPPLPQLWKSERARNPQTRAAANSGADYKALITDASHRLLMVGDLSWLMCRTSNRFQEEQDQISACAASLRLVTLRELANMNNSSATVDSPNTEAARSREPE